MNANNGGRAEPEPVDDFHYVGQELDVFAQARNWKSYWSSMLGPYIGTDVLDVGAGIGATAHLIASPRQKRRLALEPDPALAARISADVGAGRLPASCEVKLGTLDDLPATERFDTIIYADVLEHIEHDGVELAKAAGFLRPGGHVIVLSPAHQFLFTPFDKAIGHFRRYSKATLRAATPPTLEVVKIIYLDAAGVLASLGNKLLLQSAMPKKEQVSFWDRYLVPVSRAIDPLLGYRVGKSIVGVWRLR